MKKVCLLVALIPVMTVLTCSSLAQRIPEWEVAEDFAEALAGNNIDNSAHATVSSVSLQGVARQAISEHPDAAGKPLVHIDFRQVVFPSIMPGEKLKFIAAVGIREGFSRTDNPIADGVGFVVRIDGVEILRSEQSEQKWRLESVDLSRYAGRTVTVSLLTDPLKNSAFDWAVWGDPKLVIEGRRAMVKPIPRVPFLSISALEAMQVPARISVVHNSNIGVAVIAVLDRGLDLPTLVAASDAARPAVPLAPALVVGEGDDPTNHTLVRVLNHYGIADAQFLAYPPKVMGGVAVNAGRFGGAVRIVANPITDPSMREIRMFDSSGLPVQTLHPDARIAPPYQVAVGKFLDGVAEDQIAVVTAGKLTADAFIAIFRYGTERETHRIPMGSFAGQRVALMRQPGDHSDTLLLTLLTSHKAVRWNCQLKVWSAVGIPADSASPAYASAFDSKTLLVPTMQFERSVIAEVGANGASRENDVGASENRFWIQWYGSDWPGMMDGKYVRKSVFRHVRTDAGSAAVANPSLAATPDGAVGPKFLNGYQGLLDGYDRDLPALWEPCFTHRWMKGAFQAWHDAKDSATGLAKYVSLTRNNHPAEYGEFDTVGFYTGTYAFGMHELDNLYIAPLSRFLSALAPKFRSNPEHFVALEPNHEHEIAVDADGSVGDYNLRMIEGFFGYLRSRYGSIASINSAMKTHFTDFFDAPRNWNRDDWDSYSKANPFFLEWIAYNRYVVNRRVAQTYSAALGAGFPPEVIKSHQIPDTYAVGNLSAFSTVTTRFTPIDWELNCGAGYGFTRYGVWYHAAHDALIDAHASGFDSMTIGEYQALTPGDADAYGQLKYIQTHGGLSTHCMMWPTEFDHGFNASMGNAISRLLSEDAPRPCVTGGVGQIRSYNHNGVKFNIVCIGTGPEHTGLLKSLTAEGKMEGTVYVSPFHAHVAVKPLEAITNSQVTTIGPLIDLDSGNQVEITLRTTSQKGGRLQFAVVHGHTLLPGLSRWFDIPAGGKLCRFVLRGQLPTEGVHIELRCQTAVVKRLTAVQETEITPKLSRGSVVAQRHRGGLTFDILPE